MIVRRQHRFFSLFENITNRFPTILSTDPKESGKVKMTSPDFILMTVIQLFTSFFFIGKKLLRG